MNRSHRKNNPVTISDFRKLGKRRLAGKTPQEAYDLHQKRKKEKERVAKATSVANWLRLGRKSEIRPNGVRLFPLESGIDYSQVVDDPRKKRWAGSLATYTTSWIKSVDCGRYSSRCTYTKYDHYRCIESWGYLTNGKLYYRVDTGNGLRSGFLSAPRGWRFDKDENGLKIVSKDGKKDYHPINTDFYTGNNREITKRLTEKAKKNYETRREAESRLSQEKRLFREADKMGVLVCLKDSILAGNCVAGSTNWCSIHGIDPTGHIRPAKLLASANGDYRRVAIVVAQAIRRHRREMEQGFCNLEEHRA